MEFKFAEVEIKGYKGVESKLFPRFVKRSLEFDFWLWVAS